MGEMVGAAMQHGTLITWGTEIRQWRVGLPIPTVLVAGGGPRGEGGCIVDSGSSNRGIVVQEGVPFGNLVLRRAPRWTAEKLDTNVQMHDCVATRLGGKAGIVVVHRYAQVRFYVPPEGPGDRWTYRELYSIYTPSRQGGLLMAKRGFVVGNYWMEPSPDPEQSWREFAINTYSETPDSATMRLAWLGQDLVVAQGHMAEARLARFTGAPGQNQLWFEQRLGESLHLRYLHGLSADGERFIVGENAGPGSRLFLFPADNAAPVLIGTTNGIHSAFLMRNVAVTVGATEIRRWNISGEDTRRRPESNPPGAARKSQ